MGSCQSNLNGTQKNLFRKKPMSEWTVIDVTDWLSFVCDGEFKSLAPLFTQNHINGQILKNITDQEIKGLIQNTFIATRFKLIRNAQLQILEEDENKLDLARYDSKTQGIDRGKPEKCDLFLKCSLLLPSQTHLLVKGYIHNLQKKKKIELYYPMPDGIIQIIIQYTFKSRFVLN